MVCSTRILENKNVIFFALEEPVILTRNILEPQKCHTTGYVIAKVATTH